MSPADPTDSDPPTSIDPYAVLSIPETATPAEVKTAYKKLALQLHPDKAAPADRPAAHKAFQDLAFAYAILSDERRRRRYDATGNTSESLDLEDGDFNWTDFFRAQYAELVTLEKIDELRQEYQGSDEEKGDVLKAYTKYKGDLNKVFESVMLSNILDDEDRFRGYIDSAIRREGVQAFKAYVEETEKSKEKRRNQAKREKVKAEKEAQRMKDNKEKKKDGRGKASKDGLADLAALIQQRGTSRANTFLDDLEAKYAGNTKSQKKGKREPVDEPSEEAFAAMAKKKRKTVDEEEGVDEPEAEVKKTRTSRGRKAKKSKA